MPGGRFYSHPQGRHHAGPRWHPFRIFPFVLAVGCAAAAATLAVVAADPQWLRVGILCGLLAAFAPALLPTIERRPSAGVEDELARLRAEVAALHRELDVFVLAARAAPAPLPSVPPAPPPALQLPLIRAALAAAAANGNGQAASATTQPTNGRPLHIDLTDRASI